MVSHNLPLSWAFFDHLVGSWFMQMHEIIRRKVHLTYSNDKSWKSSILGIRFIENVDLTTFSKEFLLLNNRKQTMRTKKCAPNFQTLKFGTKYPFIGPNQLTKSHWKHICWTLNVFSKRPRKDMELTTLHNGNDFSSG